MDRTVEFPTKRLRALLLEADPAAADSLRRSLEARCFAVSSAEDGTSGLALLLDELLGLDVLVMAVDLPHRDARSFADLVRRAGGERDLAIVVLANEPSASLRSELLALGVDAVVDRLAGAEAAAVEVQDAVAARWRPESAAAQPAAAPAEAVPSARNTGWALSPGRWSLLPV